MLEKEQLSPFKETLILYTLSGAIILIGASWVIMFGDKMLTKKTTH